MNVIDLFPTPSSVCLLVGDQEDEHRILLTPSAALVLAARLVDIARRVEVLAFAAGEPVKRRRGRPRRRGPAPEATGPLPGPVPSAGPAP